MSDLTADQEALQREIAQAISDPGSFVQRLPGESVARWSTRAVLPIVTQREAALREDNWPCVVQCLALTDLDVLREKINALADDDNDEIEDLIEQALDKAHGHCGYECCFSGIVFSHRSAKAVQARLRGLVSGDNQ